MSTAREPPPPKERGALRYSGALPKILLVDDRRENLLATERVLRHLDAMIFKATSGNEALSLMLRHSFAVVLLDVQMPEMDGFETAKLMREHDAMSGTPIIFVSAISKEEMHAAQVAELGAVDFVFKPINPEIFKGKVKVYLDIYLQREQILKLNGVLRQSNEELERFAYICSHDMQEPVRMINIYAEMLEHKCAGSLDESGHKYLKFITGNAKSILKMIRDILAFSRIGREELHLEEVDCNEVMRDILAEFESAIAQKRAIVTVADLPTLRTSGTLMRVLLQNLLGNALKFQDGSKPPEIRIHAKREGEAWLFSVADNGIGIAPEFHPKVFTIFQRIHRKEEYPGTGIGLSTCKKFIELHGGRIWFESVPRLGTTFYFTITQKEHPL